MLSAIKHSKIFLVLFVLLFISSMAFATRFGDRACYRTGSMWYCARYDSTPFRSYGCAGDVPAPHLNLEQFRGPNDRLYHPALINWHIGWKQINNEWCVVAYEQTKYAQGPSLGCKKFCYKSKAGQAGDILSPIGFPNEMKYQSDVSNTLQRLNLSPGTSPFTYTVVLYGITIAFLGTAASIIYWLAKCYLSGGILCGA